MDPNTSVVRFLHVSVRDYLTSRSTDWFPNIETEIAKRCITYFNFDAFSAEGRLNDQALEIRLQSYPLLEYAAHFWYLHLQQETEDLVKDQIVMQ